MDKFQAISRPLPDSTTPYQSGIADPRFPLLPPKDLENDQDYELYKGLVDKQHYVALLKANVAVETKGELKTLFQLLSDMAYEQMEKKPSVNFVMAFDKARIPESWRVTITFAYGYSLFVDAQGNDRFDLGFRKPKNLRLIPTFPGDEYVPANAITDLLIVVASDHPYVNVAAARYFAEYVNKLYAKRTGSAEVKNVFVVKSVEQGFGRPDTREFLRFNDGIDNLRANIDLEKLVFVDEHCGEPAWCIGGSYLVYKKIREMMPVWEAFSQPEQEGIIGREKETSLPLSRQKEGVQNLTPVYPDHKDAKDGPLNAHIRKVQPRRSSPDLFGMNDLDRRFLRRPYPFFDGVDELGNSVNGLHFLAFMKSIQHQFEHVTNMWQMNPDFPVKGTGIDALYAKHVLKGINGGYYFCPPARNDAADFIGSGLFTEAIAKKYPIPKHIYGFGITFVDIDETIFNTFATVKVIKDGQVIRDLNNQEFNGFTLGPGESFDFGSFRDADTFLKTSKPIVKVIAELKKILNLVSSNSEGSRVVFLTARSDFDNKEKFLNTFRKYGIDIDSARMFVERSGNLPTGTVAEKKKQVVGRYLAEGKFRRVRLIDDNIQNLEEFLTIKKDLDPKLIELIRRNHFLDALVDPIDFYAYHVDGSGEMSLFEKV